VVDAFGVQKVDEIRCQPGKRDRDTDKITHLNAPKRIRGSAAMPDAGEIIRELIEALDGFLHLSVRPRHDFVADRTKGILRDTRARAAEGF
jgi:hypothetical protein